MRVIPAKFHQQPRSKHCSPTTPFTLQSRLLWCSYANRKPTPILRTLRSKVDVNQAPSLITITAALTTSNSNTITKTTTTNTNITLTNMTTIPTSISVKRQRTVTIKPCINNKNNRQLTTSKNVSNNINSNKTTITTKHPTSILCRFLFLPFLVHAPNPPFCLHCRHRHPYYPQRYRRRRHLSSRINTNITTLIIIHQISIFLQTPLLVQHPPFILLLSLLFLLPLLLHLLLLQRIAVVVRTRASDRRLIIIHCTKSSLFVTTTSMRKKKLIHTWHAHNVM